MSNESCPGCGSTPKDREACRKRNPDENIPLDLTNCPHCGSLKCCMCDMGDDVRCISCDRDEEDDDDVQGVPRG